MAAKEILKRIQTLKSCMMQKNDEAEKVRSSVDMLESMQSSAGEIRAAMSRLNEIEASCASAVSDYCDALDSIINEIHKIDDGLHVEILYRVYVSGDRLEKVAVDLDLPFSEIKKKHAEALKAFEASHTEESSAA